MTLALQAIILIQVTGKDRWRAVSLNGSPPYFFRIAYEPHFRQHDLPAVDSPSDPDIFAGACGISVCCL